MPHEPVLAAAAVESLLTDVEGLYVDGTVGGAGHATRILDRLGPGGRLWGFDWDEEMLATARERLAGYGETVRLFHAPFSEIADRLREAGERATGILLDLGLNSEALDRPERGLSYRDRSAPLDMRMDRSRSTTAGRLLADASEEELFAIFRELGETRRPRAVAAAIVRERRSNPPRTVGDLIDLLRRARAVPGGPAELSRVFQALRLAVNDELGDLDRFLASAADVLNEGGRLVVLSYESLSDRRVKSLHHRATPDAPSPRFRLLTRKVVRPAREEVLANPRARSARMRAMERTA